MDCRIDTSGMHYEGICIRPPSEAYSILLQVTVGCSHNKCTFCGAYKEKKFRIKDDGIILKDILYAAKYMGNHNRLFLMDGDALVIPQKKLLWILDRISEYLPNVRRIGIYANAKSIKMKTLDELVELGKRRMGIIYYGVETGDDETLLKVNKGSDAANLIEMGRKVKKAGIKLSVTVLLGIAGKERSEIHAKSTGRVLSEIDPNYVGALTVMLRPGIPLYNDYRNGRYQLPSEMEALAELREMISCTDLSRGQFLSNHASNYLPVKIRLPRGKQEALNLIDSALRGDIKLRPEWMRGL